MSQKQTQCPECSTIYYVSVAQLTVAQGMVCCAKCNTHFNALSSLISKPSLVQAAEVPLVEENPQNDVQPAPSHQTHVLDIFERKVENSNIDLKTYLNNLNYFIHEPVTTFPQQPFTEKVVPSEPKHGLGYYLLWGLINLVLFMFLSLQMLWFNPHFVQRHPILNQTFEALCVLVSCESLNERYAHIQVQQLKLSTQAQKTQFQGALVNGYSRSLPLPLLKISLLDQAGHSSEYLLDASQYLEPKYRGIARIPTQTPFKFSFELPVARNSFENYRLEIIKP